MNGLKINITIDDIQVSQKQLALVQYFRIKHVLHEMKLLGANLQLSDSEIEYLPYQDAKQLLINIKSEYPKLSDMKDLYNQPLEQSDKFWRNIVQHSDGLNNLQESQIHLSVTGLSIVQLQKIMSNDLDSNFAAAINPEHFYSDGNTITGQHIIETFGCFGEPTEMILHPEKNGFTPVTPNPDYPVQLNGYSALGKDDNDLGGSLRAFHQIKPTTNGFEAILAAYVPSATPKEIVNGHKWHLAIEFSEMLKYAASHQ